MASKKEASNLGGRGRNKRTSGVDRVVGQKLRLRRKILQMSQRSLAQRIGITPQQLQKYEAGRNRVSAVRLYQLADELKVPLPWFFPQATSETAPSTPPARPITDFGTHRSSANEDDIISMLTYFQRIGNLDARRILVMLACFLSSDRSND